MHASENAQRECCKGDPHPQKWCTAFNNLSAADVLKEGEGGKGGLHDSPRSEDGVMIRAGQSAR